MFPVSDWLALMIGNSHLHWGQFKQGQLQQIWDTSHNLEPHHYPHGLATMPLAIASVVPEQLTLWQAYAPKIVTLDDIPLRNLYGTLGIDRALAIWGAGLTYGFPCLVIDGGTALTLTAVDAQRSFVGGAILPGLGLQFTALGDRTAALPLLSTAPLVTSPARWGRNTTEAIQSGVFYTCLAGLSEYLKDWQSNYGQGRVVLTGGDSDYFEEPLSSRHPELKIQIDRRVIFLGMQACYEAQVKAE